MRRRLSPLLFCPLCPTAAPLRSPVTLPCGHTVCSIHYRRPCPLPTCSYTFSSRVICEPAHTSENFDAYPNLLDVTVNKVLDLFSRHPPPSQTYDDNRPRDYHQYEEQNDSTGGGCQTPTQETYRSFTTSNDSFKTFRRQTPPTPLDPPEQDLVQHLRQQTEIQRKVQPDVPLPDASAYSAPADPVESAFEALLLSELTCEICFMLLYQPITTPCQHTFCYRCLHRSLDHNSGCPLCRRLIPGYAYFLDHPCNKLILALLVKAFPVQYLERGEAIAAEEREARLKLPILVGQVTFPDVHTKIHIHEPRYRLMLRRCLEYQNPHFGVMPPRMSGNPTRSGDFGTIVSIQCVRATADGRSMVETVGIQRFCILEQGMLDGYLVARIEIVEDFPDDPDDLYHTDVPPATLPSSSDVTLSQIPRSIPAEPELATICNQFIDQMRQGMAPWVVQRVQFTFGEPPSDIHALSYYVANVLPISDHEKAKLLPLRSPHLRLRLVVHWIEQLSDNWWYSNGCIILDLNASTTYRMSHLMNRYPRDFVACDYFPGILSDAGR